MKKLLALLTAAVATLTSAWAATPVAVWCGDIADNSTRNGITLSLNGNTVEDGIVTIGGKGVLLTTAANNRTLTVVFKYSDLAISGDNDVKTLAVFGGGNNAPNNYADYIGIAAKTSSLTMTGVWNGNGWATKDSALGETKSASASGVMTFAYDYGNQTRAYLDGELVYKADQNLQGDKVYVHKIGVGGKYNGTNACTGMKISAIAVYDTLVSESDAIADIVKVSDASSLAGLADKNVILYSATDTTVTLGSATTLGKVTAASAGDIVIADPENLTATTVEGSKLVLAYDNTLPSADKQTFLQSEAWTGTVWLKNKAFNACLDLNPYGNTGSTIRLTNVTGYNKSDAAYVCNVPVELINANANGFGVAFVNGWSYNDRPYTFSHLKGSGTLSGQNLADKLIIRIADWEGFTGIVKATNKSFVFGTKEVSVASGKIYISEEATVTSANFASWVGDITIDGTVVATAAINGEDKTYHGAGTLVLNATSGHLIQTGKINFGGTIKALLDKNNANQVVIDHGGDVFPGRPEFVMERTAGSGTLTLGGNVAAHPLTVRDFSGNGVIANNYGGAGTRTIDSLQTKETTFAGVFGGDSTNAGGARKLGLTVRGNAENQYQALTLSGANTSTAPLTIAEYGKVILTGSWAGNIVVDGIFVASNQIDASKLSTTIEGMKIGETDNGDGTYTYQPVSAGPTAIVTPVAAKDLPADIDAAYVFTIGEAAEGYEDYDANFEVSFNRAIAQDSVVLKGSYGAYLWQQIDMPKDLAADEVWTLLPAGTVNYGEVMGNVVEFTCGVKNYAAENAGATMTVELVLTKEGEEKVVMSTTTYTLTHEAATIEDLVVTEDTPVETIVPLAQAEKLTAAGVKAPAITSWASKHGVTTLVGQEINVDAFVLDVAPTTTEEEMAEIVASEITAEMIADLAADGTADLSALEAKYPYADISMKEVTTDIAGEEATNTHLYKLVIELKK